MEEITDLKDPRIHPDKMDRIRSGARQEFRTKGKNSFKADFYINARDERHLYLEPDGDGWKWVNGCGPCNGEKRSFATYIECEKHNVCAHCDCARSDLTEAPWGRYGGWVCKPCADIEHDVEKAEALAAMPSNHRYYEYEGLNEIKCPYCDFEYSDSWESYDAQDDERQCDRCDNTFTFTAVRSVTFDCSRRETTTDPA